MVTLLLTLFTLGIGIGSLLCNRFTGSSLNIKLVTAGALGMTVFGVDLFIASGTEHEYVAGLSQFLAVSGNYRVIVDVLAIGIFGGLYIVPLFTYVQHRVDAAHLSRVVAGNNILNALFMVCSAVMAMLLLGNGVSIAVLLLLVSVINLVVGLTLAMCISRQ